MPTLLQACGMHWDWKRDMFGFSNAGRKPWKLQNGMEVDVPEQFNTTKGEDGRVWLYPQGDTGVPPAAMMPKTGFFFDNIVRGGCTCDEAEERSAREDFKDDFGLLTDDQLRFMEEKCNYYYNETEYGIVYSSAIASLGDFHEIGVDILNPVQLSAVGMDGKMLKERWGDKFVFWGGGVDTQKTLPFGTPEEVYSEVTERLELFSKGGGFVFNTIHNIQGNVPVENLLAMFRAVEDFRDGEIRGRK